MKRDDFMIMVIFEQIAIFYMSSVCVRCLTHKFERNFQHSVDNPLHSLASEREQLN